MTTTTTPPAFRYLGVTDECVECQKCGKTQLRSTVVLAVLDVDGNTEDVTYYGSSCAAKALSIKGGGRAVLQSARWAHDRTLAEAEDARASLDRYSLPHTGEVSDYDVQYAALLFAMKHKHAVWAPSTTPEQWREKVRELITDRQAKIADAALLKTTAA